MLRQAIDRIKELEKTKERLQAEVMLLRRLHVVHMTKSECECPPNTVRFYLVRFLNSYESFCLDLFVSLFLVFLSFVTCAD